MTSDANKGITGIAYNFLNLPTQVSINGNGNTGTISYIYDATGVKLQKTVGSSVTAYAGNHIYENGSLQFFNHPEGYVNANGGAYEYIYQYKDHLGNVRLSYTDANGNGTIETGVTDTEIIEESNYYPFGMKHLGYNGNVSSLGSSFAKKFKYQGQELNNSLGYGMYEFELRHYDPTIGRFVTTDPYEQFMSPYLAMGNNPVVSFDPDGGNCFDANGNSIACPNDDIYDEYRDNDENHITVFDEVVLTPQDSNQKGETVDNGIRKITPDKFPSIFELSGIEHTLAEIELNLTGSRTVTHLNAKIEVDAYGNVVRGPIQGGAGGIEFLGNPAGAVKVVTSARSLVRGVKLPSTGKIRFIPRPSDIKNGKLLKKDGGFVDKFGNIWKRPKGAIQGEAHWDVTLSTQGKSQLGHLSRTGQHINVTNSGKIAH